MTRAEQLTIGFQKYRFTLVSKPRFRAGVWKAWFRCQCGTRKYLDVHYVTRGNSKSCGCLKIETARRQMQTHGGYKTRLYRIWITMRARCRDKKQKAFRNYGALGIRVCQKWQKFSRFRAWAEANGYNDALTIDRKRNDRGYSPSNCRWTTRLHQNQNRRKQPGGSSQYLGVQWASGKWRATICADGDRIHIGRFESEIKAARARDKVARRLHGEYAVFNFPRLAA